MACLKTTQIPHLAVSSELLHLSHSLRQLRHGGGSFLSALNSLEALPPAFSGNHVVILSSLTSFTS